MEIGSLEIGKLEIGKSKNKSIQKGLKAHNKIAEGIALRKHNKKHYPPR
jgi:hypothetical protein